ncbi:MAG: FAD-binding oxidoreductase [Patescibacteria group bacterium]|nr:FAD-binding oxidoreductase [Patescibacteria group bacterium]
MSLAEELQKVIKGEVEDSPQALEANSRDASLFYVKPEVVVHPLDADDVCRAVEFVTSKKQKGDSKSALSLTARAAGTDMSGGPLSDSIILDMTKHFDHIIEVGDSSAIVEPGVYFRDFDKETKRKDLELPSYTASRELNTVGGMVANNSGGEKNLKYGKTARYVEKLDVVLSDGQVHHLQNLEGDALKHKLEEPGFEGDLYRRVSQLVKMPEHKKVIEEHKPKVEKNSSGYALWGIGDGEHSLNLARLMVGAQGTLGIFTKIWFKLVHPKPYAAMTILFLDSIAELGEVVPEVLGHQPDSFESYDDHTFSIAMKYLPELATQMKSGLLSLGISFLPELWMVLTGGVPKLVLIVEFRADTQEAALQKAEALAKEAKKNRSHIGVRIAKSEAAARKYWAVRRESFNLLRKKIRGKRTAPFIDDFVVPPMKLPEFLPKLQAILSRYKLTYTIAGHVGDGNFHIIPLVDPKDPTIRKTIDELSHKVYDLVVSYQGSITGEHNDGLIRTPYVEKMFGPEMYALFHEVKVIFDPLNIFNPGKKVGGTFSDALTKLDLPSIKKIKSKRAGCKKQTRPRKVLWT